MAGYIGNVNKEFVTSPFRKELFKRDWRVRIGIPYQSSTTGMTVLSGLDISELDIDFEVEKDLTAEPNKCTLKVYNLLPDVRYALEEQNIYDPKVPKGTKTDKTTSKNQVKTGRIRVEIEAGFKETGRALIFRGDLRRALSTEDSDKTWVTSIEGEDGGRTFTSSRVSESFPAGTTRLTVVKRCLEGLGLGPGNLYEVEGQLLQTYSHGTVLDGTAAKELAGVLRAAKLTWSIQDGSVMFLNTGKGRARKAVLLDYASGLIGSPERDTTGLVLATSLLNPDLQVGTYVYLDSNHLKGTFLVSKVSYSGQTAGDEWYAKLELKPG
jgi:hypothetical protein